MSCSTQLVPAPHCATPCSRGTGPFSLRLAQWRQTQHSSGTTARSLHFMWKPAAPYQVSNVPCTHTTGPCGWVWLCLLRTLLMGVRAGTTVSLAAQPPFSPRHCPLTYPTLCPWGHYRDRVESPAGAKPDSARCSPRTHRTGLCRSYQVGQAQFSLHKPVLQVTLLSSMCLEIVSRISCSFPRTAGRLTGLDLP